MARKRKGLAPGYQYKSELEKRHPYIVAHNLYVAGQIPAAQAAAMVATDREFVAECDLGMHGDAYHAALAIVSQRWAQELLDARNDRAVRDRAFVREALLQGGPRQ